MSSATNFAGRFKLTNSAYPLKLTKPLTIFAYFAYTMYTVLYIERNFIYIYQVSPDQSTLMLRRIGQSLFVSIKGTVSLDRDKLNKHLWGA